MITVKNFARLMRINHWVKNLLVFTVLIFSFSFNREAIISCLLVFIAFCFFSSSVYIINDIFDCEKDRLHPTKKNRPIASGSISVSQALFILLILLILGVGSALLINEKILFVCLLYLVINLLYSYRLKGIPVLDVMVIAFGFVLRVYIGGAALNLTISHWLLLCTFFISLFIAFSKRKIEMNELGSKQRTTRESIVDYTHDYINQMLTITAGISVVFFSLYTIDETTVKRFGSDNLIYTTPIVIYAILRYYHLLYNKKINGDLVEIFLKDKQFAFIILIWLSSILYIYFRGRLTFL